MRSTRAGARSIRRRSRSATARAGPSSSCCCSRSARRCCGPGCGATHAPLWGFLGCVAALTNELHGAIALADRDLADPLRLVGPRRGRGAGTLPAQPRNGLTSASFSTREGRSTCCRSPAPRCSRSVLAGDTARGVHVRGWRREVGGGGRAGVTSRLASPELPRSSRRRHPERRHRRHRRRRRARSAGSTPGNPRCSGNAPADQSTAVSKDSPQYGHCTVTNGVSPDDDSASARSRVRGRRVRRSPRHPEKSSGFVNATLVSFGSRGCR